MKWLRSVIFGLCLIPVVCLGQTIQFWKFGSASDSANQGLAKWVDQWNKENPDKQVQIRFFPFGEYMDGTLLTTAFASGSGPDIFWASPGTFLQYAKGGVLADISDLFTPEAKQDFSQASIDAITIDGKQYAMPFDRSLSPCSTIQSFCKRLGSRFQRRGTSCWPPPKNLKRPIWFRL